MRSRKGASALNRIAGFGLVGIAAGTLAALALVRANPSIVGAHDALVVGAWLGGIYGVVMAAAGSALALTRRLLRLGPTQSPVLFSGALIEAWFCALVVGGLQAAAVVMKLPRTVSLACAAAVGFAVVVASGRRLASFTRIDARLVTILTLACIVIAPAFTLSAVKRPTSPSADSFELGARRGRVFLIGVDGADWRKIDALIAEGRLPTFARLVHEGVRAPLKTHLPTWSPRLWTTIATGCPADVHGVLDFTEAPIPGLERNVQRLHKEPMLPDFGGVRELAGLLFRTEVLHELPISACHRRVPALWNILSTHDRRVAVVNWYATWPAEPVNGFIVSDNDPARAASLFKSRHADVSVATQLTYPEKLLEELSSLEILDPGSDPTAILDQPFFQDLSDDARARLARRPVYVPLFRIIQTGDAFATAAAEHLLANESLDLLMLYLPGIDHVSHRSFRELTIVDRYYDYTDALLHRIVERADASTTILLVSDHGWEYQEGPTLAHFHGPDGVFIAWGAGVQGPAVLSKKPTIDDVAPTVLAVLGFPRSSEMSGAPIVEVLPPETRTAAAARVVRSFGPYVAPSLPAERARAAVSELQLGRVKDLQGLGYVK